MGTGKQGFTLIEIIVAAVIGSLVAAGVLNAFLTAIRISQGSSENVEAVYFAQQTLDRFRNRIACDDPWFNPATPECDPIATSGTDALPAGSRLKDQFSGTRTFTVTPFDCDGDGVNGDCLQIQATVTGQGLRFL